MRLLLVLFYFKIQYLWSLKLFNKAEDLCRAFLEKYPTCELIQNLLAETFKKNRKFNDAVVAYEKLLEMSRDEPMNYIDFIRALYQVKDYNKIIIIGEDAISRNFGGLRQSLKPAILSDIWWYLAFSYYFLENYQKAKIYFEKIKHIKKWEQQYNISKYIEDCKNKNN